MLPLGALGVDVAVAATPLAISALAIDVKALDFDFAVIAVVPDLASLMPSLIVCHV